LLLNSPYHSDHWILSARSEDGPHTTRATVSGGRSNWMWDTVPGAPPFPDHAEGIDGEW